MSVLDMIVTWAEALSCLISLIAIFISIGTVRSQNRVALFEKRYEVYSELRRILDVAERTSRIGINERLTAADAWDTILGRMNWTHGTLLEVQSQRVTSEIVIRQMDFLYKDIPRKPVEEVLEAFRVYINETYRKQEKGEDMWDVTIRRRARPQTAGPAPRRDEFLEKFFQVCSSEEIREIEKEMKRSLSQISKTLSVKRFWAWVTSSDRY